MPRTTNTSAVADAISAVSADDLASAMADLAEPAGVVSAVLLTDLDGVPRGYVVQGAASRINPLIPGKARAATAQDIAIAGLNVRILD